MKKLLIGLVVIILLVIGSAYYVGSTIEQKFLEMEAFLSENQFLAAEVLYYKRGLLRSEALTQVKIKALDSNRLIKIKHTIWHGPIIIGVNGSKPIAFQMAVIQSEPTAGTNTNVQTFFKTTTIFKYNGETEANTAGGPFFIQGGILQISGQAWNSKSFISKNWSGLQGEMNVPETVLQIFGMSITLKDIQLKFDQKRTPFGNWLGDVDFSLKEAFEKNNKLQISDLQFNEHDILRDQTIDDTWSIKFKKVVFGSDIYGPMNFVMQLLNIDPEALRLVSQIKPIKGVTKTRAEILRQFLLRKPKAIIKHATLTLPEGDLVLDSEVSVGGPDVRLPINKEDIIKTLEGTLHASIPKEVFKSALGIGLKGTLEKDSEFQKKTVEEKNNALKQAIDLKIQKLKTDEILTEKEKTFEIQISFVQGKWIANGKEVSPLQKPVSNLPAPGASGVQKGEPLNLPVTKPEASTPAGMKPLIPNSKAVQPVTPSSSTFISPSE